MRVGWGLGWASTGAAWLRIVEEGYATTAVGEDWRVGRAVIEVMMVSSGNTVSKQVVQARQTRLRRAAQRAFG